MKYLVIFGYVAGSALITGVVFVDFALNRLVARDEGFYLMAAKLVSQSRIPYLDFFYPQGPLIPLLYAPPFFLFHEGFYWQSARLLTATMALFSAIFMLLIIRRSHRLIVSISFVLVWALSPLSYGWLTTAQGYTPSVLLMLIAIYAFKLKIPVLAGVFLALTIQSRALSAIALPVFLLYIDAKSRPRFLWSFIAGLSPLLALLVIDPEATFFNNIGYHLLRPEGHSFSLNTRVGFILSNLNILKGTRFERQFGILLWLFLSSIVWQVLKQKRLNFETLLSLAIFFLQLLPSPFYLQYFVAWVPIAILAIAKSFLELPRLFLLLNTLFVATLIQLLPQERIRYQKDGRELAAATRPAQISLVDLERLRLTLSEKQIADDELLSIWPGFIVASNIPPVGGLENHFALRVADQLHIKRRRRLKLKSESELAEIIAQGKYRYIVSLPMAHRRRFKDEFEKGQYKVVFRTKRIRLLESQKYLDPLGVIREGT